MDVPPDLGLGNPEGEVDVSFGKALRFWAMLGFINFGGPAGQIALMHRELVERRKWVSEERFLHALNYCMLLPGPEAQQLSIYLGWLKHKTLGGLAAGTFFVLPSVGVLFGLSVLYVTLGNNHFVVGALWGCKAVVVAIVFEAAIRMGKRALKGPLYAGIAAVSLLLLMLWRIPFPFVVLGAALLGMRFGLGKPNERTAVSAPAAATPRKGRTLRVLASGVVLWSIPFAVIVAYRSANSLWAHLYVFFTKAALVTFGGAYAALAYVTQSAVAEHGWITPTQAVDGLALAETTPGPLVMVLQFVGFMAGWNHPEGATPMASGIVAGLLATYATFLPSFVFIFAGAPYVERLTAQPRLTAALTATTAAVTGTIVALGLTFARTVFLPTPGGVSWSAVVLCAAAFLVLARFRFGVAWVVLAGSLLGVARQTFIAH